MALTIVTFLWGDSYGIEDVVKLASGLQRHLKQTYRFIIVADARFTTEKLNDLLAIDGVDDVTLIEDAALLDVRGCFARLRIFDPAWQQAENIDGRIGCIDLDVVITGPLDPLFDRPEPFVILQGANASNPCPYNGSLMMLRAGAHPEVWTDFTLEKARQVPFYEFPDDQGWLAATVPNAAGWQVGSPSGVYAFQKPGWPKGEALPDDARLVVFPGWRSPEKFKHLPWIREHWRIDEQIDKSEGGAKVAIA